MIVFQRPSYVPPVHVFHNLMKILTLLLFNGFYIPLKVSSSKCCSIFLRNALKYYVLLIPRSLHTTSMIDSQAIIFFYGFCISLRISDTANASLKAYQMERNERHVRIQHTKTIKTLRIAVLRKYTNKLFELFNHFLVKSIL